MRLAKLDSQNLRSFGTLKWPNRRGRCEGWEKWYPSGKRGILASCGVELAKPNVVQLDPYCQWSFNEIQRNHSSLLPAKSSDQVADIDPFTTVLFSDVRPTLFEMRYLAARLAFRLAWLSFLGLHVPGLSLTGTVCILLLLSHHHISSTFRHHSFLI